MKNKQKARRRCAWILSVLLCIVAILPVLFIPAAADTVDGITPPNYYVSIRFPVHPSFDYEGSYTPANSVTLEDLIVEYQYTSDSTVHRVKIGNAVVTLLYSFESAGATVKIAGSTYSAELSDGFLDDEHSYESGYELAYYRVYFNSNNAAAFSYFLPFAVMIGATVTIPDSETISMDEYLRGYGEGSSSSSDRYDEGYRLGMEEGEAKHADDYNNGYAAGIEKVKENYQLGYTKGKADGEAAHADDYKNGFAAGQTDAMNGTHSLKDLIFLIFSAPADLINGILDFDLFGINVASLVKTLITLAVTALIVVFLIKLMKR